MAADETAGATGSAAPMRRLLRGEAAALSLLLAAGLWQLAPSWPMVVVVLLLPDVTLAGYALGPRVGARVYNLGHSAIGPVLLAALAIVTAASGPLLAVAGLWGLHVSIDRALGFGLKYPEGFGHTHLGRIGRARDGGGQG